MTDDNYETEATPLYIDLKQSLFIRWDIAGNKIAQRDYYKSKGANVYVEEVRHAVYRLWLFIRAGMKKDSKENFDNIEKAFKDNKIDDIIASFWIIDDYLYKKGVTKYDTKEVYERKRVEIANRHRGL